MPSGRSAAPGPCSPICRATPTGAPSPIAADHAGVTFRWKDYRIKGPGRYQPMALSSREFIRRFLMQMPPGGFHRIRHYGLLAQRQPRRQHRAGALSGSSRHARIGKPAHKQPYTLKRDPAATSFSLATPDSRGKIFRILYERRWSVIPPGSGWRSRGQEI